MKELMYFQQENTDKAKAEAVAPTMNSQSPCEG